LTIAQNKENQVRVLQLKFHLCSLKERAGTRNSSELREMWRTFVLEEGKEVGREGGR